MKRLSFITQFKIEFLLWFTVVEKCMEKCLIYRAGQSNMTVFSCFNNIKFCHFGDRFLIVLLCKQQSYFDLYLEACVCKFLFLNQVIALQKLRKMLFILSKKLVLFLRYSNFCNFFASFLYFLDSEGEVKVE